MNLSDHCPACGMFRGPRHRCPGYGWCQECDSIHDLRGPCRRRVDGWIVALLVAAVRAHRETANG